MYLKYILKIIYNNGPTYSLNLIENIIVSFLSIGIHEKYRKNNETKNKFKKTLNNTLSITWPFFFFYIYMRAFKLVL